MKHIHEYSYVQYYENVAIINYMKLAKWHRERTGFLTEDIRSEDTFLTIKRDGFITVVIGVPANIIADSWLLGPDLAYDCSGNILRTKYPKIPERVQKLINLMVL